MNEEHRTLVEAARTVRDELRTEIGVDEAPDAMIRWYERMADRLNEALPDGSGGGEDRGDEAGGVVGILARRKRENPHLRLGQIIVNAVRQTKDSSFSCPEVFYTKDADLADALRDHFAPDEDEGENTKSFDHLRDQLSPEARARIRERVDEVAAELSASDEDEEEGADG